MSRSARVASALVAAVAVTAEALAVAVSPSGAPRWNEAAIAAVVLAYAAVGLLIVWHHPKHPVGRIALALAPVWGLGQALVATSYAALSADPGDRPAALASVVGGGLRGLAWLVAALWLPLRFPDGQPLPTRLGRAGERLALLTLAAFCVSSFFATSVPDMRLTAIDNPVGLPVVLAPVSDVVAVLTLALGTASITLSVACLVQRYRRGGAIDRQQTLIFGLSFLAPISALAATLPDGADPWVFGLATLPVPVAIGVAVLQHRLYDVSLAVNRSLLWGMLWLAIAALYALVVGGVGAMLRQQDARWLPWLAAGVVAVSIAPLREALQRAANRLTYGQWSQPTQLLATTARRLGDAGDVPTLLQSLVTELGTALDLRYVAITDPGGRTLAVTGSAPPARDELPMTSYGAVVGTLTWARRPLRATDRSLLEDLARQLGTVVHAAGLLDAVRASQERLVLAREEERRRLRRDLHDGLGPALAGLGLRVDTLRNVLAAQLPGPWLAPADEALLLLRSGIQDAVGDVRRIVEGLRPPALDELGLGEAVEQLVDRIASGTRLAIDVETAPMPRLPAGVEVAAYRIIQEALTNTVRHSGAGRVDVVLRHECARLIVMVRDDGSGAVVGRPGGVGLLSMRERAEEIGGRLTVRAAAGAGTTVSAILPIGAGEPNPAQEVGA